MANSNIISEYLKDLTQLKGVEAIALYSSDNTIIASWSQPDFNAQIFEDISINYFQIFSVLESGFRDFQESVLAYDKGSVFARILPDLLLIVIIKPNVEVALVRLIVNVHITELIQSKRVQKILKKLSGQSVNFLETKYLDPREKDYLEK
jgi:hypothetical protein